MAWQQGERRGRNGTSSQLKIVAEMIVPMHMAVSSMVLRCLVMYGDQSSSARIEKIGAYYYHQNGIFIVAISRLKV
jgi:hypothetical protein